MNLTYRKLSSVALASILGFAVPAVIVAQESAVVHPANASTERSDDASVKDFLARKAVQQSRRQIALGKRGADNDAAEVRALFRAGNVERPAPKTSISLANKAGLGDAFETDTVQLLQSVGLNPGRIKALTAAGYDPVTAASAYVRGNATLQQQALLSSAVVVARVSEVRQEDLGDGFRSTVLLEVIDPILGNMKNGKLALRQASGLDAQGRRLDVSSDLSPIPGQSYVLMLSDGLYKQLALESGGKPAGGSIDYFVLFGSSYTLTGESIEGSFPGAEPYASLATLKADLSGVAKQHGAAPSPSF